MFRAASIVALAGSLLLSVASAADLPPIGAASPTPVPVAAPYWEGFYAGPSLGQAYTPGVGRAGREGDFIGGGQLGYTWQAGVPVFGVEADLGGLNGSAIDKLASLRARAGLALGRVMLYGTFGVAGLATRARVELANTPFGPDVLTNRSQTRAASSRAPASRLSSARP